MSEQENDLIVGPGQFIEVNEEKFLELITAYEDILTCKHVESWEDDEEPYNHIPKESAIKIAKRLLELNPTNEIANNFLDIEEGLLLVQFTNDEYYLLPQMKEWNIQCGVKRSKLIPRHITSLEEALKFAGWERGGKE